MKYVFLLSAFMLFVFNSQAQNWQWATHFGSQKSDYLHDLELTTSGQVLVSGIFGDTVQIGSSQLIPPENYGYGYVAKFQSDGTPVWGKAIYTNKGNAAGNAFSYFNVCGTLENEVVVSSHFANTMILGNDTLKEANGGAFLTKLDSLGNHLWARNFGQPNVPGSNSVQLSPHVTDLDGNIYVACTFTNVATFHIDTLNASNGGIFIIKFDKNGTEQWVKQCGGGWGWSRVYDLKIDAEASLYLTGTISKNAHFGSDTLKVPAHRNIAYIAKMDKNGNFLWARKGGALNPDLNPGQLTSSCYGAGIGLSADWVYCTGFFMDTVQFGNQILYPLCGSIYCFNFFLTAYDKFGNLKWARTANSGASASGAELISDNKGSVFISGEFYNTIGFDSQLVTSNGTYDQFIAKFDSAGQCNWLINFDYDYQYDVVAPKMAVRCPSSDIYIGHSWKESAGNLSVLGLPVTSNFQSLIAVLSSDFDCSTVNAEEPTIGIPTLSIYPNPVGDFLQFEMDASYLNPRIRIYSTLGSLVGEWHAVKGTNNFDLSGLPPGLYFIVLFESNTGKKHSVERFIKN